MPKPVLMPALSPTMEEGTLARWLKKEGEKVASGDLLAEIETDKAVMELEAVDEGVLAKILIPEGTEGVKVNTPMAWILEEGEDASALDVSALEKLKASAPKPASPAPAPPKPKETITTAPQPKAAPGTRIFASPLARRLAEQGGIDLSRVTGTGPRGRIVKRDVEGAPVASRRERRGQIPSRPPGEMPPFKEIPNTNIRKVIAERLTQVHQDVPTFFLSIDCTIDALLSVRKQANSMREGPKLSVNDFLIRAAALALMDVPAVNSSWQEKAIRQYEAADIAMAVTTDRGLITPVIRNAETKTIGDIAKESKMLAEKARAGKLQPEEFQGGTFTISNLGMFAIRQFDAILNPPQACILAVGAGEMQPVVKDGRISTATRMRCTLTCDHRVVDGAVGAEFLAAFRSYVEEPARILLKEAGYG